ncbi:hypothetical protein MY8738_009368 [Beauveria namnaoensis]
MYYAIAEKMIRVLNSFDYFPSANANANLGLAARVPVQPIMALRFLP